MEKYNIVVFWIERRYESGRNNNSRLSLGLLVGRFPVLRLRVGTNERIINNQR